MIRASAPGKLFIAGEYAVVEPGEPALLVAVDRAIEVSAGPTASQGSIRSLGYRRGPIRLRREPDGGVVPLGRRPDYVTSAVSVAGRLSVERGETPKGVDLQITSGLVDGRGRKFGLGSSAAVTVATIAALDRFHRLGLDPVERFRLALLATIQVAPRASGGDVAASTFGGWLHYTSPDREALLADLAAGGVAAALTSPGWEGCGFRQLGEPIGSRLLVGWTGRPAATTKLVSRTREGWRQRYPGFLSDSREVVDELETGLLLDPQRALAAIRRGRTVLSEFGRATDTIIETALLRDLCDVAERYGWAAKPSGAGGGDCGIALVDTSADFTDILHEWERRGIQPLGLKVTRNGGGVHEE